MNTGTRCRRCGDPMTLYVVGDRYCLTCKREVAARERQDARRQSAKARFRVVKELVPWAPGAA